ncbi:MAG: HPr family phosphocarrier protein [Clostridiales bacterium]|jgi:phosphotransferase system HPr (HPr) family protein|nr:HPr family phosphocarrier protein [Clostridiales bacterium]
MVERAIKANSFMDQRPAALFVQTASQFKSRIMLRIGDKNANAKSIMGMLALGIEDGQNITITADGEDEISVIPALEQFFNKNRNE